MGQPPPISIRNGTRRPYTTLFRSPARRRSLLPQRRQLAADDGVVVQRVALDRDAVAVAFEVVQLHELAGDQVLDEQREAARIRFAQERPLRSEEYTSELQSLMRISYAVFCLKKKSYKNIYRS